MELHDQETTSANGAEAPARRRVFSGIQPSGEFHLGNYVGAVKNWLRLQSGDHENFYCVVDLHSLTVPQNPEELRERTRSLAGIMLAAGIDPEKSTIFVQSHVSAHAEGCWLLNCVTPLGWLHKMTQYKDKSSKQESVLTGLLDYPVLMAADILLYDTSEVPVGEDQKQHVELARNIAERFNHIYGPTFVVPQPVIAKVGARIMGLDNPEAKMSKTYSHIRGHAVRLLDDPKEIEYAFKRAVTDPGKEIHFSDAPEKAGVNNLLSIYKVITGRSEEEVEADFADARGYGDLKKRVAEVVIEEFAPVRERYNALMSDTGYIDGVLRKGAEQAHAIADVTLRRMKEKMGLIVPG